MQTNPKIERLEFEVLSQVNPLQLNLNTVGKIISCELEEFDYAPTSSTGQGWLGVSVNGLKGRYNKNGNGTNSIKTIPYVNGRYSILANGAGNEQIALGNTCNNLNISFINRVSDESSPINPSLVTFSNNYLLTFSLFVERL